MQYQNIKDEFIKKNNKHFERMLDELFELNTKTEALRNFINKDLFTTLSLVEQENLKEQEMHMSGYLNVLYKRIEYIRDNA